MLLGTVVEGKEKWVTMKYITGLIGYEDVS